MTLQVIEARLNHPHASPGHRDLYCFDAPEHGLVAEPFMESATMAIHVPLRWSLGFDHFKPDGPEGPYKMSEAVLLRFTDYPGDLHDFANDEYPLVELTLNEQRDGGHVYDWQAVYPESVKEGQAIEGDLVFSQEAWLCPALLNYFPDGAPDVFWVQIQEIKPPTSSTGPDRGCDAP